MGNGYPKLFKIKQHLYDSRVDDVELTVRTEMQRLHTLYKIKPGSNVAITAGSRGLADFTVVLASIVKEIKG